MSLPLLLAAWNERRLIEDRIYERMAAYVHGSTILIARERSFDRDRWYPMNGQEMEVEISILRNVLHSVYAAGVTE